MSKQAWSGSTRNKRLPANWSSLRNQVAARAGGQCEALLNEGTRCLDQGTDCDHILAGDNHDLNNLQWLCRWHHNKKSSAEGNRARRRFTEQRPQEAHPGLNG
jgi:5-methylcytosine-specific restriction protein A